MSEKKPAAADAVYEWLGNNPGAHTIDQLTTALPNVKKPTLAKALTALVNGGQIHTRDIDGAQTWSADLAADTVELDKATVDADGATVTPPTESETDTPAEASPPAPDVKVMAIAFVLARTTTGLTAEAIATGSGLPIEAVWPVLAAMHTAEAAACDRDFVLDPEATWTAGPADPTGVNVANAPDHVRCPLCGNAAPVPGRKSARKRGNGGSGSTGGPRLGPGQLYAKVDAWVTAHPDTDVTPGQLEKELGHSAGAIREVFQKMERQGKARQVHGAAVLTFHTIGTTGK